MENTSLRNVAIIAHVDHGKTTLVDGLLRQSGVFRKHQALVDRVMDSHDLEKERGITILSKNTAIEWKGLKINIVDTPGHADFGGEVERVLGMVDATLLVVDANEGPMPQTRFVLRKSLEMGHRPIVVINKVDRLGCRPDHTVDLVFDLFVSLQASDEQLDFPVVYCSAKEGWATLSLDEPEHGDTLEVLLDAIVEHVPVPPCSLDGPLQLQVATLDHNDYLGRIAIGRIFRGSIERGMRAVLIRRDGTEHPFRVQKLMGFIGLERTDLEQAHAGDIVALAGVGDVTIGETVCPEGKADPIPPISIEEPTISMIFSLNDGPFAGKEGKYVTSRHLRGRLFKETERNVSIVVRQMDEPDSFEVCGRGELQLAILIEQMRREGYEFTVSRPKPILKKGSDGETLEPMEEVVFEIPEAVQGIVLEKLGSRRGEIEEVQSFGNGYTRLVAVVPSRGLIGYRNEFLTDSRGEGTMVRVFRAYMPWKGPIVGRRNGALIALEQGDITAYALVNLQDRGAFFVQPGEAVYHGQVVGEHTRQNDLVLNPCKAKHLTNHRQSTKEETVKLNAHRNLGLDAALEFIGDDELVEVSPISIRVRKRVLSHHLRRRADKQVG